MYKLSLAAALLISMPVLCNAQTQVEWTQTLSTPKGATVPSAQADIMGIELGDSYAEAKAKLQKLFDEGVQPRAVVSDDPMEVLRAKRRAVAAVKELTKTFSLQSPGSSQIVTANYVAELRLERETKGVGPRNTYESFRVFLSAPASGHQVIAIERNLKYFNEADQPRVTELIQQVNAKLRGQPFAELSTGSFKYQFNDGKVITPPTNNRLDCTANHTVEEARQIPAINKSGDCDAVFLVKVNYGISRDHAEYIQFVLSDNERTKANLTADFAFVQNYVRNLQERTKGTQPKL